MPCSEFDCDNDFTTHTRSVKMFSKDLAAGWPGRESLWTKPRGFAKRSNPGHPTCPAFGTPMMAPLGRQF